MFRGLINVEWINVMIRAIAGTPLSQNILNDEFTTDGGAAAEAIAVAGALTTDHVQVTLVDDGANNVTVLTAKITAADEVTVTFSGDPADAAIVSILITRDV